MTRGTVTVTGWVVVSSGKLDELSTAVLDWVWVKSVVVVVVVDERPKDAMVNNVDMECIWKMEKQPWMDFFTVCLGS